MFWAAAAARTVKLMVVAAKGLSPAYDSVLLNFAPYLTRLSNSQLRTPLSIKNKTFSVANAPRLVSITYSGKAAS